MDIKTRFCNFCRLFGSDAALYFGSVRFFKNMIFLAVVIMILIPALLAARYRHQAVLLSDMLAKSQAEAAALRELDASQAYQPQPAQENESIPAPAEQPAYQTLYPDFYAPQPYSASERHENTVYLTFDDGPSSRTDEILVILEEKDVKATFFVIGQSGPDAEKNLERMRRIAEAGHSIGMHSFSHVYSEVYDSVESCLGSFYENYVQIRDAIGVAPTVFRFPGGSINYYNGGFYQELISEMIRRGFVPYDWNVSSEDATGERLTSEELVGNVIQGMSEKVRGFILFHDSEAKTATVQALGEIIDRLREQGYAFEAITPSTLPVLYGYTY